ncbi:hypothetical protein CEXT_721561 [Caerostris extrusa]|uniref:Uncharacterized protein n=1 Tax=Caerostris extrusa TaxID=172846 RepID=A0AAV4M693_CAEEX|nr:hypothetical protein CEXT_721561 [Caerostris extrusa]
MHTKKGAMRTSGSLNQEPENTTEQFHVRQCTIRIERVKKQQPLIKLLNTKRFFWGKKTANRFWLLNARWLKNNRLGVISVYFGLVYVDAKKADASVDRYTADVVWSGKVPDAMRGYEQCPPPIPWGC